MTEKESLSYETSNSYDTLVVSGGSHKGMILLGAIQCALDNLYLKNIVNFIGTSAGSMICYLLAIGYTPEEIMVFICTHRLLERMTYLNLVAMINGDGASSYTPIQETLEAMTLAKIGKFLTMKELRDKHNKNFICATYNRTKQIMEYISADNYPDLPCLIAIRMSSSLPLLFSKFRYMGCEYVDGGIADNCPVMEAERVGNRILCILLEPKTVQVPEQKDEGALQYIFSLLYVPINQSTIYRLSQTTDRTTVVRIPTGDLKFFDFNIKSSLKLDMFSKGYQSFQTYLKTRFVINEMKDIIREKLEMKNEADVLLPPPLPPLPVDLTNDEEKKE